MKLRIAFLACLTIWLVGALATAEYGRASKAAEMLMNGVSEHDRLMLNVRGISIRVFGTLSALLALALAARWGYRKMNATERPAATKEPSPNPPTAEPISLANEPESGSHQPVEDRLRCDFSGWTRAQNRIVKKYEYLGQGLNHKLIVEITLEAGTYSTLRFLNLFLYPSTGAQGHAEILFTNCQTSKNSGWLLATADTAADRSTLLGLPNRESSDAALALLLEGGDLDFSMRQNGEMIVSLPMPNDLSLRAQYDAVRSSL